MQVVRTAIRRLKNGGWVRALLGRSGQAEGRFEQLEARCMMDGTPLPDLEDLESSQNTVVRLETNFGDVDIELFNSQAPITVANFVNYVTSGRYDNTFFHRHAINPNPFVLQGGGFSYSNSGGLGNVSTDAPIIRESTGKLNIARTLAMARTGAINSATSQFFINYVDNAFLNPTAPDNGYAVFGRIIQGWDVITDIQDLDSRDLRSDPAFAGDDNSAFNEVPVTDAYSSTTGVRENSLVTIINAEVIKPGGVSGFFSQQLVMPEGFRSGSTTENLEIFNPNTTAGTYQVIARYESGSRDSIIASGTIAAGTKLRIQLSDAANSSLNVVRSATPYSLVIQTALPAGTTNIQPIAANLNRVDFNSDTGEAFFNATGYSDTQLRTWDFARVERNANSREFLSWVNLSGSTAAITVTFHLPDGSTSVENHFARAYRRGGLDLSTLGLPTGVLGVRITSTQNIVAFLSDFDMPTTPANWSTSYTPGFGVMGTPGGGADAGGMADAVIKTGFTNSVSILNAGGSTAVVTLNFWRTGRAVNDPPITAAVSAPAGERTEYTLNATTLGIPVDEKFTITYTSSVDISLQYTSVDEAGRYASGTKKADGVSTMFETRIAPVVHFTDGADIPTLTTGTYSETVTIFNPYSVSGATFNYTIRYNFSDGTTINAFTGSLTTNGRVAVTTSSSTQVRAKINSGNQFRTYSISVIASGTVGSTTTQAAGLVQLTRIDTTNGRSFASTGSASGFGLVIDDPTFIGI